MNEVNQKLTLDRMATYLIKVPGHLDKQQSVRLGEMAVSIDTSQDGLPYTTLTVSVDQAALQGLLRRLYTLGLPLISINCVEISR